MQYRATGWALSLAVSVFGAFAATAAEPATSALAGACTGCHGPEGRSSGAIPSLAGMPRQRFIERMQAYRRGTAEATIMDRIAPAYDDKQIAALAEYFAARDSAADEHRHAP